MSGVQDLIADPDFSKLSVAGQRSALSRFDPEFSKLSDQDLESFKTKMGMVPGMGPLGPPPRAGQYTPKDLFMGGTLPEPGSPESAEINRLPVLGGPVLPTTGTLAAGVGSVVGYGTERAGRALGLPEWISTAAGLLTGVLSGGTIGISKRLWSSSPEAREKLIKAGIEVLPKGSAINKLRALLKNQPEEMPPPTPGKGTGTKYGGPAPEEYGQAFPAIPKRISGTPISKMPSEATPPGKGTGTKFGGAAPEESGSAFPAIPKRTTGTPASKLPTLTPGQPPSEPSGAPTPFRPNPRIQRLTRFGGASEEDYSAPKPLRRPTSRQEPARAGSEVDDEAGNPTPTSVTPATAIPKAPSAISAPGAVAKATNQAKKYSRIAEWLHGQGKGVSPEMAKEFGDKEWDMVYKTMGEEPSGDPQAARKAIISKLKELRK